MNSPIQAEIEFPSEEVAAAFDLSENELEGALATGLIKVEQEPVAGQAGLEQVDTIQFRLTFGEKVVVMPITLRNRDVS